MEKQNFENSFSSSEHSHGALSSWMVINQSYLRVSTVVAIAILHTLFERGPGDSLDIVRVVVFCVCFMVQFRWA